MDIRFQYVKSEKSESLEDFTQKKLDKLENKYDFIVSGEVHFKSHENEAPRGKICNMSVSIPGPVIFAESNEDSYEAAVAQCVKEIDRQLEKRKAQMKTY